MLVYNASTSTSTHYFEAMHARNLKGIEEN